jgi:ribosomal protein S3AE
MTVQNVETTDGKKVHIKAVAITLKKVSKPKETTIRKLIIEEIAKANKKKDYNQLSQELIFGNTASRIFKAVSPVSALKRIEITKSTILAK